MKKIGPNKKLCAWKILRFNWTIKHRCAEKCLIFFIQRISTWTSVDIHWLSSSVLLKRNTPALKNVVIRTRFAFILKSLAKIMAIALLVIEMFERTQTLYQSNKVF